MATQTAPGEQPDRQGLLARSDYLLAHAHHRVPIEESIVLDLVRDLAGALRAAVPSHVPAADEPNETLKWWFLLVCRECDGDDPGHWHPMPFTTENDREDWADEHAKATGHDTWSNWREAVTAGTAPGGLFAQHPGPSTTHPDPDGLDALVCELREAVAAYEGKTGTGPDGWQDPHDAEQFLANSVDGLLDEIERLRASGEGTALCAECHTADAELCRRCAVDVKFA